MGRNRERPTRQVIYQETLVKNLGSLPVVAHLLRQLDVQGVIDRAAPIREVAHLTHGEIICAMVANRLTAPQPLCHFNRWAERWAVEEVFGAKPEYLNDDRLGRALDAIAPHLETLQGSVTWSAMEAFGVDVSEVHYDLTSITFAGAYEDQPDQQLPGLGPRVTRGYSSAEINEKQIQVGAVTTADGIPVWHEALGGSAQQVSRVIHTMESLKKAARVSSFTIVGDSKLISHANMLAACKAGVSFCAPSPTNRERERAFLEIPRTEFQPLCEFYRYAEVVPFAQTVVVALSEVQARAVHMNVRPYWTSSQLSVFPGQVEMTITCLQEPGTWCDESSPAL